jgi:hypothetical protein
LGAVAALFLLVTAVTAAAPGPAQGWTYGPEYLARTENVEVGDQWYAREVYCREVYWQGGLTGAEVVRTVDHYRGPVMSYGAVQVAASEMSYRSPPHLCLVTTYERVVYRCGRPAGKEALPELTRVEDVCAVSEGQPYAVSATLATGATGPGAMVRVVYSIPVYHSNARYGTFLVGHREAIELVPAGAGSPPAATAAGANAGSSAGARASGQDAPLDEALRTINSVREFRDYLAVQDSPYRRDIEEAFELGLIVGKYDQEGRFYDPNGLITLGEMVNILARNYGAPSSVADAAAVGYLASHGVAVQGDLGSSLTLSQLAGLAVQLQGLDQAPRADLIVMRQAIAGGTSLSAALSGGITREYAVAMFRPVAGLPAALPGPIAQAPPGPVAQPGPSQGSAPTPAPGAANAPTLALSGHGPVAAFVLVD